ncbi:MAG: serine hydrolase domain-containing protein [Alphaproteobacteria bacterium]
MTKHSPGLTRRALMAGAAVLAMPFVQGAAPPTPGQQSGAGSAASGAIQQRVARFLAEFSAPGVSLAYGRNGSIDFAGSFGMADPYAGEPLGDSHRFRIASVSKPLTAAAIMMLAEHGRLRLDQPVFGAGGLLGSWFPIDPAGTQASWLGAITVDHLLTHTAGGWTNDGNDPMFRYPALGHADLIATTLREAPLINPPGAAYAYSNFGYCLLGRIVEATGGAGYAQFVQSRLLAPSGIRDMAIAGNTRNERGPGEVVYVGQGGDDPYAYNVRRMDSHGGWVATASDLVLLAQRLNGDDGVPDLIGAQSVGVMRSPSAASSSYGRGWAINPAHQNRWHAGALPGCVSMLILQAGGPAFAGLVNTRTRDGRDANLGLETLLWDVRSMIYG